MHPMQACYVMILQIATNHALLHLVYSVRSGTRCTACMRHAWTGMQRHTLHGHDRAFGSCLVTGSCRQQTELALLVESHRQGAR